MLTVRPLGISLNGKLIWPGNAATCVAALFLLVAASPTASAQQCKPKTAGYFLEIEPGLNARSPGELAGIAASLTGSIGDPVRGGIVMADGNKGNCLACHRVPSLADAQAQGDLGTNLNGVGARYTEPQLRQLIVDPKVLFPTTVMPAYHKSPDFSRVPPSFAGQMVLSPGEVEDVIAFLKNLK